MNGFTTLNIMREQARVPDYEQCECTELDSKIPNPPIVRCTRRADYLMTFDRAIPCARGHKKTFTVCQFHREKMGQGGFGLAWEENIPIRNPDPAKREIVSDKSNAQLSTQLELACKAVNTLEKRNGELVQAVNKLDGELASLDKIHQETEANYKEVAIIVNAYRSGHKIHISQDKMRDLLPSTNGSHIRANVFQGAGHSPDVANYAAIPKDEEFQAPIPFTPSIIIKKEEDKQVLAALALEGLNPSDLLNKAVGMRETINKLQEELKAVHKDLQDTNASYASLTALVSTDGVKELNRVNQILVEKSKRLLKKLNAFMIGHQFHVAADSVGDLEEGEGVQVKLFKDLSVDVHSPRWINLVQIPASGHEDIQNEEESSAPSGYSPELPKVAGHWWLWFPQHSEAILRFFNEETISALNMENGAAGLPKELNSISAFLPLLRNKR